MDCCSLSSSCKPCRGTNRYFDGEHRWPIWRSDHEKSLGIVHWRYWGSSSCWRKAKSRCLSSTWPLQTLGTLWAKLLRCQDCKSLTFASHSPSIQITLQPLAVPCMDQWWPFHAPFSRGDQQSRLWIGYGSAWGIGIQKQKDPKNLERWRTTTIRSMCQNEPRDSQFWPINIAI